LAKRFRRIPARLGVIAGSELLHEIGFRWLVFLMAYVYPFTGLLPR
jgi:hypothetical protein